MKGNPVTTKAESVAALIFNSLSEQNEGDGYVSANTDSHNREDLADVTIDGHFDLMAIAEAVVTEVRSDYE